MTTMSPLMARILSPGSLRVRFQPIVEIQQGEFRVRGVEGLVSGPPGSSVEDAAVLFDYVRRKRAEVAVDRTCVALLVAAARGLPACLQLSLNVHAATLSSDPGFLSHLLRQLSIHGFPPSRVTVEIVEHAREWAGPALQSTLRALRERGVSVALDDVGQGQSNYRMIVDCRPDYFKIDGYFSRALEADPYRQAVLHSVAALASRVGAHAVIEGVEEESALRVALGLGISLFQGNYFCPAVDLRELQKMDLAEWAGRAVQTHGFGKRSSDEVRGCAQGATP